MPSYEWANEIKLGRKKIVVGSNIPRSQWPLRGEEIYDLWAVIAAAIPADLFVMSGAIINPNTPTAKLRLTLSNASTVDIDVSTLEDTMTNAQILATFSAWAPVTLNSTASTISFLGADWQTHTLQINVPNEVYRWTTAPTSPQLWWLWVDTTSNAEILKQWNWTIWSELDRLSVSPTITADTTISDWYTFVWVDWNSGTPINLTLPSPVTEKWRHITFYKWRWSSQVNLITPAWTFVNINWWSLTTYPFQNTSINYLVKVRSDWANWVIDDDNLNFRVDNTLFVDTTYWNNLYAAREFMNKPFATVAAAVAASQANDTIVLRNGSYAMWTITLPYNLNFQCDNWVTIASWVIVCSWNRMSWVWWKVTWADLVTYNSNADIYIDIDEFSQIWISPRALFQWAVNWWITNVRVVAKVKKASCDNPTSWSIIWAIRWCINSYIDISVDDMIWNFTVLRWAASWSVFTDNTTINISLWRYETWSVIWTVYRWVEWIKNSKLNFKIWYIAHPSYIWWWLWDLVYQSSLIWNYNNIVSIEIWYAKVSRVITWLSSEWDNIYVSWNYHEDFWSSWSMYYMEMSKTSYTWLNMPSTMICFVKKSNDISTLNNTTPWSWYWIAWWVFWLKNWSSLIINWWEHQSLNNSVIWSDNDNPWTIQNIAQQSIKIYWSFLKRINTIANTYPAIWWSYPWIIFHDCWNPVHNNSMTLDLLSWSRFQNNWDDWLLRWIDNVSSNVVVNIHDNISTNNLTLWVNADLVNYLYQPTKVITASWTYTVLDSDSDLYYNLTLGNMTLVLPDPTKFINREIQLKITALHATNTVTIDVVGSSLIDNALTYIVPWTNTKLVNIVFKSQNWAWRIK